jgi:hypothetical protein
MTASADDDEQVDDGDTDDDEKGNEGSDRF